MSKQYTYEQIATNYELFADYVDTAATMTKEDFEKLSVEEKIGMQTEMFGEESSDEEKKV